MNIPFFLIIFLLLQGVCFLIARRVSKKMTSNEDYFLAGRSLRFFPLMMTLIATQIGGGLILGSAEEAYRFGWIVLLYPIGACLGLIVLALGIGKRMSRFKVSTVAQLFEVVYGSPRLKRVASMLSIFSLFFILVAQVIASRKFMLSLGVDGHIMFVLFWAIVIAYTTMGGLKAVVATDIVQAAFFIIIFLFCFLYSFFGSPTSPSELLHVGEKFDFNASKLTGWLLMPLLFMVIEQDMGQRCFAAKSGKIVSWASALAALCTITVCIIPVFFGVLGKIHNVPIKEGSSILMGVIGQTTSPLVTALVGCAIMAAIISTADSLINAISSNVSGDFGIVKNVRQSRLLTALISIIALFASFAFNNVVDLLILSYELSVSALFVPIFMALFIKRGNSHSALLSLILGACGFLLFRIIEAPYFPREVLSLLLSWIGYGIGEVAFKAQLKESEYTQSK